MKKTILMAALACAGLLTLSGCAWGGNNKNGWQGFSPNGDYDVDNLDGTVSTPWGTQHLHADHVRKRNNPIGSNPLPPLPATNSTALAIDPK